MTDACPIEGCGKPHLARGYCRSHYRRLKIYGDPLAGAASHGEPWRFYRAVVLAHDGDECLTWPYAKANGYGRMQVEGRLKAVSRLVCEAINGPPPTPEHEAAHSCGRGHLGCVTKRHLSWKTAKENASDKLIHGTHLIGERNSNAKLTETDVVEILALRGTQTQREIAERFGVSPRTISAVQTGTNWHLEHARDSYERAIR